MQKSIGVVLFVGIVLLPKEGRAQQLVWNEVPSADRGCATSIAVGPNNDPWVIGCGTGADRGIYYLTSYSSCSPPPCFGPDLHWQQTASGAANTITMDLNGNPYVVNSIGDVWFADQTVGSNPSQTGPVQYNQLNAWTQLTSSPPMCVLSIAPGEENGFGEFGLTAPNYGDADFIYGLGCGLTGDAYSDQPVYSWNLDLTNGIFGLYWNPAPWERLSPSTNAGAGQIVLFNGPPGPSNPQTLWILDRAGGIWQYYNGVFNWNNAANLFLTDQTQPVWLTDHYLDVWIDSNIIGYGHWIYQWNDSQGAWVSYMTGETSEGTSIVQIASSQSIAAFDGNTYGPSQLWGLDTNGHIFYAAAPGMAPR